SSARALERAGSSRHFGASTRSLSPPRCGPEWVRRTEPLYETRRMEERRGPLRADRIQESQRPAVLWLSGCPRNRSRAVCLQGGVHEVRICVRGKRNGYAFASVS